MELPQSRSRVKPETGRSREGQQSALDHQELCAVLPPPALQRGKASEPSCSEASTDQLHTRKPGKGGHMGC